MKTWNIVFSFVVLVILVGVYFATVNKQKVNDVEQVFVKFINPKHKEEDVRKIAFFIGSNPGNAVEAEKKDGKWVITSRYSYAANSGAIDAIVRDLIAVEGEFRSDSEKLFREYSIDDESALHFQIEFTNGEKQEILCGKRGPEYSKSFARLKGESKVYLINKNLLTSVHVYGHILSAKIDVPGFVDLKVFKEKLDVSKVVFFDKEQKFNIFKAGAAWSCVFPAGVELDESKVKNWISTLSYLSGKDAADPEKLAEYGLLNSQMYLEIGVMKKEKKKVPKAVDSSKVNTGEAQTPEFEEIEVANEVQLKLLLGKVNDTYYMKNADAREVYSMDEAQFKKIFIGPETLKKEEKKEEKKADPGTE